MQGNCLRSMASWRATQAEAMTCRSTRAFDSTSYVHLLWESNDVSCAAVIQVKSGKKSARALADLGERTADTLFSHTLELLH